MLQMVGVAKALAAFPETIVSAPTRFGEFRVPSLRNAALTGPYMHNGGLATLRDVVWYYSELIVDNPRSGGEQILKPLKLSAQQTNDLIVFLESLTDYRTNWRRNPPGDKSACGGAAKRG
jgi:cytochrome c peroxidase